MSNRLFQGVIHQMRDSIDRVIGVVDDTATVIACSDLTRIGETSEFLLLDMGENQDIFVRDGYTYKPFGSKSKPEFAVFVEGSDEMATRYCGILAVALAGIKQYYDEKYDRNNFIKNVILDNILPGDIYVKAREMHFNSDVSRVVLLIRIVSSNDISAFDVIQNLFPNKQKDFVFNISESDIVLVKEIKAGIESRDLEKLARSIVDTLGGEFYTKVVVGIGTAVVGVKDLAKSFKEAQVALEVGKVFDTEKSIVSYDNLGIARLIYQLPTNSEIARSKRSSRRAPSRAWTRRRCSPSRSSLRTTSTSRRPPGSCSYTATRWSTAWRRSKSSPGWTCGSLTTHRVQGGADGQEVSHGQSRQVLIATGA